MTVAGVDGEGVGAADALDGAKVAGPRGGVEVGLAAATVAPLRRPARVSHLSGWCWSGRTG